MTVRAIILGLVLALLLAGAGYINDAVIRQTYLVGHLLPPAVFGLAVLLLLAGLLRTRRSLKAGEVIVITALMLAGAGWPGNSFMRGFTPTIALHWQWARNQPAWQAAGLQSYLPEGSPRVAPGQVRDMAKLADLLQVQPESPPGAARQAIVQYLHETDPVSTAADVLRRLNAGIVAGAFAEPDLYEALNLEPRGQRIASLQQAGESLSLAQRQILSRAVVGAALPHLVSPMPTGTGLGVTYESASTPELDRLMAGAPGPIDWGFWRTPLLVWVPLAALMGLATVCLIAIVHPQWANHELLPYPIARFLSDLVEPLRPRPDGTRSPVPKLFWIGLGSMLVLHCINGLAAYFPGLPHIPLNLDFTPLQVLFPNAARAPGSGVFSPTLQPSIIAFALFVSVSVGMSLGVSNLLWVAFAAFWIGRGVPVGGFDRFGTAPNNMLLLGAYLGAAVMIGWIGRSYYGRITAAAMFLRPISPETPRYATWAARLLPLCTIGATVILASAGLSWPVALITVLLILMMYIVTARILAESGMLFLQANWVPYGALLALFGFETMGPTAMLLIGTVSIVLAYNPRDVIAPHLAHGLYAVSRNHRPDVPRFVRWQAVVVLLTLLVVIGVTLLTQSRIGFNQIDSWATRALPSMPYRYINLEVQEAAAVGRLAHAVQATPLERLRMVDPDGEALSWAAMGLVAYLVCQALRLRLVWWPLHPVLFLVWGTRGSQLFAASFLLGALLKWATLRTAGVRGINHIKPLMIGIIAGEVLAALAWSAVGAVYFGQTELAPPRYLVFPG